MHFHFVHNLIEKEETRTLSHTSRQLNINYNVYYKKCLILL